MHAKLACQKPILRQIEWWVQNGHHKEWSFASSHFIFFENFISVKEPLIKSWFDVPTTYMFIFVLFVSAEVLFGGAFSLWVSLNKAPVYGKPQSLSSGNLKSSSTQPKTADSFYQKFVPVGTATTQFKGTLMQIWKTPYMFVFK